MASTVQGLDRLKKKLEAMPKRARVRIREALEKSAQQIHEGQVSLAEPNRRSGDLIDGLKVEDGDHELQVKIVSLAFYSRYVEFGTSHSAAEPFFFPAYRLLRRSAKARIRYAVGKAAKEAAGGR